MLVEEPTQAVQLVINANTHNPTSSNDALILDSLMM
jgi:hypothetical protein